MAWVLAAITLAVIAFLFWQLWGSFASEPAFAEKWKKLTWQSLATALTKHDGLPLMQLLISIIAPALLYWGQRRLRGSSLILSNSQLTHHSGLPPWLGNLMKQNWSLSLDDLRSGRLAFTLSGPARANASLALYALSWKAVPGKIAFNALTRQQQLAPASWFLPNQKAREPIGLPTEHLWFSLNPWATPEGQAALQSAFDRLPMVAALRAQGVPVPAFPTAKGMSTGGGVDLMAYPRMKAVVLGFFGLLVSAGLAYHLLRHQHYFDSPPFWAWAAFGACCTLGVWQWLAAEQVPDEPSLKPTQGLVAVLFGVAAALLAPSGLLGLNQLTNPAKTIFVTVKVSPLLLQPDEPGVPAFTPAQALEFWASQSTAPARQIAVRKGLFGTWQYDSEPLEEEVHAFYRAR